MVVVGAAGLALGLSWTFWFLPRLKKLVASNHCLTLELRFESYHRRFSQWPEGGNTDILLAMRGQNPGRVVFIKDNDGFLIANNAIVDPWETAFRIERDAGGVPRPVSAGPNKRHGDGDDIDSRVAREDARKVYGSDEKIPKFEPEASPVPPRT